MQNTKRETPSAGARRAARAIVADFAGLLGTPGDPEDDAGATLAQHIERETALAELVDALRAAAAYVELFTGNGTTEQPPEWAINKEREEYDSEVIAKRCRAVLAKINGEG